MNEMVAAVAARRPRTMVPLLTAIFVIAWALLTLLVVMQDRMIDAQAAVIHTFLNQSVSRRFATPLHVNGSAAKKTAQRQATPKVRVGKALTAIVPEPGKPDSADTPISQIPLSERASAQSPSTQVRPKAGDKSGRSMRKGRSPFSPPPVEITDPSDQRRVLNSI